MASRKDNRGRVLERNEYQRKNGTYRYDYQDIIGTFHSIYAPDLATLRDKEKKLKLAQWQGVDVERGNTVTFNDVFDRYMNTKFGLKESTLTSYLTMYDRYVRDEFGKQLVKNIRYSDVQNYYADLLKNRNLGMRTVEYLHMMLHPTFDLAVEDGIILKNPTKGLLGKIKKAAGYSMKKRHALTIDQQRAFLEFIYNHPTWGRYHSIFQVMLGTGLRVGELIGLRWEDVDFEKKTININHGVVYIKAYNGVKEHPKITLPKTDAGIRIVPLMDPVIDGFREEYKYSCGRGFSNFELDGYSGFIFTKQNGNLYSAPRLDKALSDIVAAYNKQEEAVAKYEGREPIYLPHFSCHNLRHTFCTRLCERDVNIKVIQSIMGHANIKITMDIYAEVSEEKKRMEMDKLASELDVF